MEEKHDYVEHENSEQRESYYIHISVDDETQVEDKYIMLKKVAFN